MPKDRLTLDFPPEDWILDFHTLLEMKDQDAVPDALRQRIYERHPDSPIAEEYGRRFSAAYMYLLRNMKRFDVPSCAVVSETGSAILTDYLFYALYLLFMLVPVEYVNDDWPVEAVIQLAQSTELKRKQ